MPLISLVHTDRRVLIVQEIHTSCNGETIEIKETGVSSGRRSRTAVSPADGHLTTPTEAGLPGLCENFRPTASKS